MLSKPKFTLLQTEDVDIFLRDEEQELTKEDIEKLEDIVGD